mmetsp:Transcript_33597/g.44825  ORF Transcript_33597/g.44825 Transcript_33597/m.44825 type:complete len:105 (+) Transcript_33597:1116-1430(+)
MFVNIGFQTSEACMWEHVKPKKALYVVMIKKASKSYRCTATQVMQDLLFQHRLKSFISAANIVKRCRIYYVFTLFLVGMPFPTFAFRALLPVGLYLFFLSPAVL